tara:strand:- start:12 stop:539 length:528 start_codon:yes stop_codon:yes gene_type:complete
MRNILYSSFNEKYKIDLTIHSCNKHSLKDIDPVFKNSLNKYLTSKNISNKKQYLLDNLKIVCSWQKSNIPINTINNEVSVEMDRLYKNFILYITEIKRNITKHWIDASSPHTGKCLFGKETNLIYNELSGLKYLLNYDSEKMGCCGMVLHPEYQYKGYPITFFTDESLENLKKIL